jgi:hypothetical protein
MPFLLDSNSTCQSLPHLGFEAPTFPTVIISSDYDFTMSGQSGNRISGLDPGRSGAISHSSGNNGSQSSAFTVAQALEEARDSAEGARDPNVVGILEDEISRIWSRIQEQPDSYILSRDEFAVFNYFQARFVGNQIAIDAKARYWANLSGRNGPNGF